MTPIVPSFFVQFNDTKCFYVLILLAVKFSRTKFKLKPSKGNAGGCAPPDLRQGLRPWTHSSRSYLVGITEEASRAALETKYSKLSGTMKIGEIGQGKGRLLLLA